MHPALLFSVHSEGDPVTELKPTVCQICGCNCGLLVTLDRGRVTHVQGDPGVPQNRGGICIKGKMSPRVLYSPDRLKQPMIRRKYGVGFVPASWSDAVGEIASRLEKTKEHFGPESLAIYRGRSTRFIDRAFISAFAALFGTPNATGVWTLCVGPKLIGYQTTFGTPLFPRCDFRSAELILLWGTNPAETKMHRYFNLTNDIRSAVKNGAELIVVDPRRHRFAREATLHLPITPGTDSYLIMALIKILIHRNWVDHEFIRTHTSGFDHLKAAVKGLDLKKAAETTGISVETIHGVAERLGNKKPASIDRREGVIHQQNGTQINRALAILTAITGNADVSGGLRFNDPTEWNIFPDIENRAKMPAVWSGRYPMAADGAQVLTDAILEDEPYPVRALISVSGNPVSAFPDTKKTLNALGKLDLLVVNDLFMTETARVADIVLPGVTFFEKGEFHTEPLKPVPWLQTTEPLVSPMGAAKPEWRFMAELADEMGFPELIRFVDADEFLRQVFADSGRPDLDPADMRHGIRLEPTAFGKLRENGFNTPSGKIELYSHQLAEKGHAPLPEAEDVCRCSALYPYRLVTGSRVDAFNHSQHRNIAELLKRCPHPEAEIGPDLAHKLGMSDGDFLTIETEWGKLDMRAKVVEGMSPVTVSIPHGWPGNENANYLVGDVLRDAVSGTPVYKAIPCSISKCRS
jgi:formate dehydrogenase (coenzyme F420) alpha subunit